MRRVETLVTLVILAVLVFVGWQWRHAPFFERFFGSTSEGQLIASAHYQCEPQKDGNGGTIQKTIDAEFFQGADRPASGNNPPVPGGSVKVKLSDGRSMELNQTISADGVRYANEGEAFVFWSKGNGVLVLENGQEGEYRGCIKVADDPGGLPLAYSDSDWGFSIRYATGTPMLDTGGVHFRVDSRIASGTNLSSDTQLSIETLSPAEPDATLSCEAKNFLEDSTGVTSTRFSEGNMSYSYATSSGAAAGNRYEEIVYALPGTEPCMAVHYFIHYGVFENYPEGTVRQFDRNALLAQFDAMRKTLVVE